jgi:acyl-coenzyme A thioesterase 9
MRCFTNVSIFQIGYTNAYLFTRAPLRFLSLDGIAFKEPVPIGSILRLTSTVTHTASSDEFPAIAVSTFERMQG